MLGCFSHITDHFESLKVKLCAAVLKSLDRAENSHKTSCRNTAGQTGKYVSLRASRGHQTVDKLYKTAVAQNVQLFTASSLVAPESMKENQPVENEEEFKSEKRKRK